jgi:hypothetical protein
MSQFAAFRQSTRPSWSGYRSSGDRPCPQRIAVHIDNNVVREVTASGTITTVAGNGTYDARSFINNYVDLIAMKLNVQGVVINVRDEIQVEEELAIPRPLPHRTGPQLKRASVAQVISAG